MSVARSRQPWLLALVGAIAAGSAAALTWMSTGATAHAASVQSGQSVTASTVAFILPADVTPGPSASPSDLSVTTSADPTATPTDSTAPAPTDTPTTSPSPDPTATPTTTPSATPSSSPSATPSATPSASSGGSPSPTKHVSPSPTRRPKPQPSPTGPVASPTPGSPVPPTAQVPVPLSSFAAVPLPSSGSKPRATTPSTAKPASNAPQQLAEPTRHADTTLSAATSAGPSPTLFAVALAALGAIAASSFAVARRHRAQVRRVRRHSHRAPRQRSFW